MEQYKKNRNKRSLWALWLGQAMAVGGVLMLLLGQASAAELPSGFAESKVASVLSPAHLAIAPDGRLFVSEQRGDLRVIKNGVLNEKPFLTLDVNTQGERGLLGVAFDPEFSDNRYLYVYYTARTPETHNRVSRFTANGDTVVPNSERILLEIDNVGRSIFHNGGALQFGPDGKLYVSVGDNAGIPSRRNSQSLENLFGKVMRINKDGSIPADNPFFTVASGKYRAIWAIGFRNPYSIAFDSKGDAQSMKFFVNDVGPDDYEEINEGVAGGNYGWPDVVGDSADPRFRAPVYSYRHSRTRGDEVGCAVTGGVFYRSNGASARFPSEYEGKYFFNDYCSHWIRVLDPVTQVVTSFASSIAQNSVGLKVGPDNSLYYLSRWRQGLFQITFATAPGPVITLEPETQMAVSPRMILNYRKGSAASK